MKDPDRLGSNPEAEPTVPEYAWQCNVSGQDYSANLAPIGLLVQPAVTLPGGFGVYRRMP